MTLQLPRRLVLLSVALALAGCGAVGRDADAALAGDDAPDPAWHATPDAPGPGPGDAATPGTGQDAPPDARATAAVATAAATKPFEFDAGDPAIAAAPATCQLPGFSLPAGARVYAAGAYSGARAGFQIDDSGHEATTIKVAVNERSAPVVLMLGAYEPTVWSVGWTPGTRIAGVLVTGYHRQQVTGLPADVPMIVSSHDNRGPCGYAYVGGDGSAKLNAVARQAFGRAVDAAFVARDGQVLVGTRADLGQMVTDASARAVEDFRRTGVPLAGKAGLDAAVAQGLLRVATQADAEAWERVRVARAGAEDVPPIIGAPAPRVSVPHNGYVVLKPFQIPAGLYGAHSATFIVAAGVPAPTGNPGHSQVLHLDTGQCVGATCAFAR